MRLLDLFSGIGGFSLGLERAGFRTVAFCEVSPVCRHLLAHHWPEVPCYDDIRTLSAERLAADGISMDAICGGFPCQDASIANTGEPRGVDGLRTGLVWEYTRIIGELRPVIIIMENVAALVSRGLGRVVGELSRLGYDAWWRVIRAADLGYPHNRARLWLVAHSRSAGRQGFVALVRALERAVAALPKHGHAAAHGWRSLDGGLLGVRGGDGLSVAVERRRLHGLGNAVVPQIPEILGRAALAALQPQQVAA